LERFPPIPPSRRTAEQQALCDHYQAGWRAQLRSPDGRLGGTLDTLLRSPSLARRVSDLTDYFRNGTSLDQRINEFAILIAARLHDSQYEWAVHSQWALQAGLDRRLVTALGEGREPQSLQADERAVYALLMELARTQTVGAATFEQARAVFSEQQLVDLVVVFGAYRMIAGLLALADVQPAQAVTPALTPQGIDDAARSHSGL